MTTPEVKNRMIKLIDSLIHGSTSEDENKQIFDEISRLSPDPYWSDHIFWSNDYVDEDAHVDYDKFFDKIFNYPSTEYEKKHCRLLELTHKLINKDFSDINEVAIVNEVNELSEDISWMDYIFVTKECLNEDGSLNEQEFINKVLPPKNPTNQFFNH